jgi:hypothetical protein
VRIIGGRAVSQHEVWIPVSPELYDAMTREPTDDERAEYTRRREEREAEQRRQLDEHAHRMVTATGLRRAVLELHAPSVEDSYAYPVCRGCDADGYDWEPPEWPCSTYVLARDAS